MSFLKRAFFSAAAPMPLKFLLHRSEVDVLLPYHHVVCNETPAHIRHLYSCKDRAAFIRDLDWLLGNFTPIHPDDLARHHNAGTPIPPSSFLISFDDGYREVYETIAPILYKKGIPAIFFINPAFIDNRELFYRCKLSLLIEKAKNDPRVARELCDYFHLETSDLRALRQRLLDIHYTQRSLADELGQLASVDYGSFLSSQQPFMTRTHLQDLVAQGFVLGAHSWDHPHYSLLSLQEQLAQTERSVEFVSHLQHRDHHFFSFPHEDRQVGPEFFRQLMSRHKNLLLFGTQNLRAESHNNMYHRYNAEDPQKDFESLTKGILAYNSLLSFMNKRKIARSDQWKPK